MNRAYGIATSVMPRSLASATSRAYFCEPSPLSGAGALAEAMPSMIGSTAVIIAALPVAVWQTLPGAVKIAIGAAVLANGREACRTVVGRAVCVGACVFGRIRIS